MSYAYRGRPGGPSLPANQWIPQVGRDRWARRSLVQSTAGTDPFQAFQIDPTPQAHRLGAADRAKNEVYSTGTHAIRAEARVLEMIWVWLL